MDFTLLTVILLVLYLLASRWAMHALTGGRRDLVMALLNVVGSYYLIYNPTDPKYSLKMVLYAGIVVLQYGLLRWSATRRDWGVSLAFFTPILILIAIRDLPPAIYASIAHLFGKGFLGTPIVIGISYFAFRCSRLVLEVQNGSVKTPTFCQYLGFAFFMPTLSVGPINTYANHRRAFEQGPLAVPVGQAALRFLIGLLKYEVLSGIFSQVTFSTVLLDGRTHSWVDLPVCMVFYYLYLYCNFSGFCDMAIGMAGFIGIPVDENFNNPMAARNLKDFWNRWHISLSQWMRDIVFGPLCKSLVARLGGANINHAVAIAIVVVFFLTGIWHGITWNFAFYGLFHALGLVINHYYTIGLKQWLGREGFKAYNENRWIHAAAVVITFAWFSASTLFFANSLDQIREIFAAIR